MSTTMTRRLAPIIIRCYPRAWRARYAAEALHLLELRAPTWADLGDMAFHVLYTWLHPDLFEGGEGDGAGGGGEERTGLAATLRSSEIAIFWAVVTTMLAWAQLGRLANGDDALPLAGMVGAWPLFGTRPATSVGEALAVQSAAVDLVCVATLMGGVPLLMVAWRRSPSVRRYFVVPVAALIAAVAPLCVVAMIHGAGVIDAPVATPRTALYFAWCVGLVVASTVALSRIVIEGQLDDGLLRYAFVPAVVATLALLLATTVTWGIVAGAEIPRLVDSATVARQATIAAPWLLDVLVMTGATSMAIVATIRGARCRMTLLRQAE
jgi:hypothetical protein